MIKIGPSFTNLLVILLVITSSFNSASQTTWVEDFKNENANFFETQQKFEAYWENKEIEKGKGWKPFKRWEAFVEPRVNDDGIFPGHMLFKEWEKIRYQTRSSVSIEADWQAYGPNDVPLQNNGTKRGVGRINTVSFDPSNSDIIWAGAAAGGLWKSIDGGLNWTSNTDLLPNLGVSDIAIDPLNNNIMYIATGDRDGGDTYCYGVLKSIDGGETWNTTGLSFEVNYAYRANRILINPNNTNILIVSTKKSGYGETYRSIDGGDNFELVKEGPNFISMEFNVTNPNIIYAATTGNSKYYKSSDNGVTWTNNTSASGLPNSGNNRGLIATTEADANTVYLLYSANDDGYGGLYKSTDAGLTFTLQSDSPNIMGWDSDGSDEGGQGFYDLALAISPIDENTVFVGGVNCWKSTNEGVDWNISSHWYGQGGSEYMHADEHILKYNSSNGTLYSGNDGGLYKSENDGGNWTDISDGLQITQFYKIGVSQTNPNILLGGSQDNGTLRANNINNWDAVRGGDGMECAIDPTDESIMYSTIYYGAIDISTNGGDNWSDISPSEDGEWITPFEIDQNNPNRIVAGYEFLYESFDKGNNWNIISEAFNGGTIDHVTLSNYNEDVIYVAESSKLYKTIDGGENWLNISSGLPNKTITSIALHSLDDNRIWVTFSGYTENDKVYGSIDGGENYTNISANLPNLPVNCAAYYNDDETIFIGTDIGVWYSDSSMTDWSLFNQGLPNVIVNELEIQWNSNKMFAGTYGRGVWVTELPSNLPPTASFNYSLSGGCSGGVNFSNLSNLANEATWDFGDNTTSTDLSPEHYYLTDGTYEVQLTVTNNNGTDTFYQTIDIEVNEPPTTNSGYSCNASSINLTATPNQLTSTVYWYDQPNYNNLVATGLEYNTPVLNTSTTYYVQEAVLESPIFDGPVNQNSLGAGGFHANTDFQQVFSCTNPTILKSVYVYAEFAFTIDIVLKNENDEQLAIQTVDIIAGANTLELNFDIPALQNMTLGISGENPGLWRNNEVNAYPVAIGNNISINESTAEPDVLDYFYYFYNWEVQEYCYSVFSPVEVIIGSTEPLTVNPADDCQYDSINIIASGNFISYEWNDQSIEDNITVYNPGTYSVTAFDAEGCIAYQTIDIPSINTFEINTGNQTFCEGTAIFLQCASNLQEYNWSTGETTSSISVSENGSYSIDAIDQNGCSISSEITLSFNQTDQVTIDNVEENAIYCRNEVIELLASGADTYVWQNAFAGADYSQTLLVNGMQTFTVNALDANDCPSTATVTVEVVDCSSIEESNPLSDVVIFPNPTNGNFVIYHKSADNDIKSIKLFDIRSRLVENRKTTYSNGQISEKFNIQGLTKGVYFIEINSKSTTAFRKVILK